MTSDSSDRSCPSCGAPVGGGLCHACLMEQVMVSGTSWGAEPEMEKKGALPEAPPVAEVAALFPNFEVVRLIGRGGMGAVYQARQRSLERDVALKVLLPGRAEDPEMAARFSQEARLLATLRHPGIVAVHDFGSVEGRSFLVLEYVEGVTLREVLRQGMMDPAEALRIIPPLCEALIYAHEHGVVHRDIKPENILLDLEGRPRVTDFGLAHLNGEVGPAAGTPGYEAPEQKEGACDPRVDVYALGVILYELLTGQKPDRAGELEDSASPTDPAWQRVVRHAMARNPEERYQTVEQFSREVERLPTKEVVGGQAARPRRIGLWIGVLLLGGVGAIGALGVVSYLSFFPQSQPEQQTNETNMNMNPITKVIAATVAATNLAVAEVKEPEPIDREERQELREDAFKRWNKDTKRLSDTELEKLEELYQNGNKNYRKDRQVARASFRELVANKDYQKTNRIGCAYLYLGQLTRGEERAEYLDKAIKDYSDSWYLNGVQVGGWARFLRLFDLRAAGEERKAKKLEEEIRKKYKKAITHSGKRLVELLDYDATQKK